MPGYLTRQDPVAVSGAADLQIRSLLDRQQFADPQGLALRLGISSAAWPLFGLLWPSGHELAGRLAARPVAAGERILELGCGLALASLVAHRRGADVTASDCHPLASAFPAREPEAERAAAAALPARPLDGRTAGACRPGRADRRVRPLRPDHRQRPAVRNATRPACSPATSTATPTPHAEVWVIDPNRGNRSAFHRHMADHGFDRDELALVTAASAGRAAYRGRLLRYPPRRGTGRGLT